MVVATVLVYFLQQVIGFVGQKMVFRLKMLVTQNLCEVQNWAINLVWSFLYKVVSIFFKVTKENHSSTCSQSEDSSSSNYEFFSLQVLLILLLKSELDIYL